ncbi:MULTISPECIES: HAD family hydrolase [unclassified Curtobacterium]|uniref:HAD family hydrolase n=1 Tax=unclassified Curtobacterium TaxID=257496 RepID=UPI0021ABF37B|nr:MULTISPECIES: HAD family hydrolase [unclassified Curtobacterium]
MSVAFSIRSARTSGQSSSTVRRTENETLMPVTVPGSASWGVVKPSPEFFARVVTASACRAAEVLYVGDRLDNDILPAKAAGMRTAFIRRGPWGHMHAARAEAARPDLWLDTLQDLVRALS